MVRAIVRKKGTKLFVTCFDHSIRPTEWRTNGESIAFNVVVCCCTAGHKY